MRRFFLGILALTFLTFATSCNDDDDNKTFPESGKLDSDPFFFVVDDGVADNVSGITIDGVLEGDSSSFIVTDADGKIVGLPGTMDDLENVNFEGVTAGDCLIWYLKYDETITGLDIDKNASELGGLFDLSNSIKVERVNTPNAGTLNGGPFTFTVGDGVADNVSGITNTDTSLSGKTDSYIITDDAGKILEIIKEGVDEDTEEELSALDVLERFDFDGAPAGDCFIWYIRYEGELEGLEKDKNASDIKIKEKDDGTKIGIFDLSNSITVTRN